MKLPSESLCSLISTLLWLLALELPYYTSTRASSPPFNDMHHFRQSPGLFLFLFGWCLPICNNIAWFGNIAFGISLWRSFRGRLSAGTAVLGLALALTVFMPTQVADIEFGRYVLGWFTGPAVWAWLAAIGWNAAWQTAVVARRNIVKRGTGST